MALSSPHHVSEQDAIKTQTDGNRKETIIIMSRGLNIVWGRDNRYWRLPENKDGAAELLQVSWLEVTGKISLKPGKYQIQFEVSMRQDAFGWSGCPIFMMAKLGKRGRYSWKKIGSLDQYEKDIHHFIPRDNFNVTVTEGGETELYFGLYEVWSGKWKGGMLIHNAIIKEV